jgi:release factor glutamine methyltransferase
MLTVLEAIVKSTDFLQKKGIESARINAELLLASILKCKRLDLYLKFDKPLEENEIIAYREFIRRRSTFEPLQYITGKVEFCNLEFDVNRDVLIPRPETELLVETIIQLVKDKDNISILDIGTGSGVIAISLASRLERSQVTGIDISEKAIAVAKKNAEKYNLNTRIKFIQCDILKSDLMDFGKFDIVVSNPPYVSASEYKNLQKEIRDFEPAEAVTDFGDGFKFYNVITKKADSLLNENGLLFFELEASSSEKVENILLENNFKEIKKYKDYSDIERIICGIKK